MAVSDLHRLLVRLEVLRDQPSEASHCWQVLHHSFIPTRQLLAPQAEMLLNDWKVLVFFNSNVSVMLPRKFVPPISWEYLFRLAKKLPVGVEKIK